MNSFQAVHHRSRGRCEAMVYVGGHAEIDEWASTYGRCFRYPVEVHHMLTRSRGGLLLDDVGETMHLLALCPQHHRVAHSPGGHESGLMINGYVLPGSDGRPVYAGSHSGLRAKYRAVDVSDLPEEVSGDHASSGL